MAPKTPKSKNTAKTTNAHQTTNVTNNGPAINYAEAQDDELAALKSIYGEDFRELTSQSAWNQVTDHRFELVLRSSSDSESHVTLSVQLTATYPKSPPLLDISGLGQYHERTQQRIRNIITKRPSQLLGDVMIFAIAGEVQEALEDAVRAREEGTLPSLEDERATAEETAACVAKEAEEAQARREQAARDDEERIMKEMVDAKISRDEQKRKSLDPKSHLNGAIADPDLPAIVFDTPGEVKVGGETESFSRVRLVTTLVAGSNRTTHLGKPDVRRAGIAAPLVVIEKIKLQRSREDIVKIEHALSAVRTLRHPGLLGLLAYRVDKLQDDRSELVLCHEQANRGSLQEMLEFGPMHVDTARRFVVALLETLDYVHSKGQCHGNLCGITVLVDSGALPSPKILGLGYATLMKEQPTPARWRTSDADVNNAAAQRKSDIWQVGVLLVQMLFGVQSLGEYSSPHTFLAKHDLSDAFADFMSNLFTLDWRRKPSAFDLLPSEFLRTNQPAIQQPPVSMSLRSTQGHSAEPHSPIRQRRSRHNSSSLGLGTTALSRYAADFTEMGRLGKGGFGEVVKARNKLDGGIFAIKKITQAPQLLNTVISEVMLLNRLNHPYVVRYYSTWLEESTNQLQESSVTDSTTDPTTETAVTEGSDGSDGPRIDFGYQSTGGLDFVSSSGQPQIEFGDDSDEASEDSEADYVDAGERRSEVIETTDTSSASGFGLRKTRSDSRRAPSTLYIQMELCERRTLRGILRHELPSDEVWRYVRQITEGLAHIHSHGIIHRDLKPDNVFIDSDGNPKIGDFGLATTAQQQSAAGSGNSAHADDMTGNVGTALYVAPELTAPSSSTYTGKVDMYSLGIMFYEMCQHFTTGAQRMVELLRVRQKNHLLEPPYQAGGDKEAQGKLITCLVSHKPSERPTASELLRGEILPADLKDETIRQALSGLSDPKSPYHQKLMSGLFSHDPSSSNERVKALAWDAKATTLNGDAIRLRIKDAAKQTLEAVFRKHGAEEVRRPAVFPRSTYYQQPEVMQLLDASGNLLQLPYDLVVPQARELAKYHTPVRCTWTFGTAYRDKIKSGGGPPVESLEVDFDISTAEKGHDARDEAEVLKVMDEVFEDMPLLDVTMVFHINHASILRAILDYCNVSSAQQQQVKEIISKLGFNRSAWSVIRTELRRFGLADTTLDDLQLFDFRESIEKAASRLQSLLSAGRCQQMLQAGLQHLTEVMALTASFAVHRKIYLAPLGSVNARFYEDGMLFQCVLERKGTRGVVAAGGRYDRLIAAHQLPMATNLKSPPGAVGVSIGLEPIINAMVRTYEGQAGKKTYLRDTADRDNEIAKRCSVLVVAGGSEELQRLGMKMLASLWAADISAELSNERTQPSKDYAWVVALKHEAATTVRVTEVSTENEEDVPVMSLTSYLQQELRDRRRTVPKAPTLMRHGSSHGAVPKSNNVQVLMAGHGSKKTNKYQIVAAAQERWTRRLDEAKTAPILAVETADKVIDLIRQTRLSDADSWRRAAQSVQLGEKQYVQDIQRQLDKWRSEWEDGEGMREACLFNFRTQYCVPYDLGL